MARHASVRYYDSRGGYFTHFQGKQVKLATGPKDEPNGATYLAALDRFRELMMASRADVADQENTVRLVVALYAQHLERNQQKRSLEILLETCTSAMDAFGDHPIGELKPIHVTEWLAFKAKPRVDSKKRTVRWGPSYQGIALRTLITALNWAKGQELRGHTVKNHAASLAF